MQCYCPHRRDECSDFDLTGPQGGEVLDGQLLSPQEKEDFSCAMLVVAALTSSPSERELAACSRGNLGKLPGDLWGPS